MAMTIERLPAIRSTLQPSNHPYLTGAWTPQYEEVNAYDLEVIEGWSRALSEGDVDAAAGYFALPSTAENGTIRR